MDSNSMTICESEKMWKRWVWPIVTPYSTTRLEGARTRKASVSLLTTWGRLYGHTHFHCFPGRQLEWRCTSRFPRVTTAVSGSRTSLQSIQDVVLESPSPVCIDIVKRLTVRPFENWSWTRKSLGWICSKSQTGVCWSVVVISTCRRTRGGIWADGMTSGEVGLQLSWTR
jgi:hypothetical protein